jgi:hypothetical protein
VEVLGLRSPVPFLLGPVGVLSIVHEEAELGVARASKATGVPMVLSSAASTSLEEVAAELGGIPAWFQLYWFSDREIAGSLVDRAAAAGYDVARRLPALAAGAPLPDRHPARELHWRLLEDCPAALPTRGALDGRARDAGSVPDVHSPTGSPHIHGHTPPTETDREASTRARITRGGDPP